MKHCSRCNTDKPVDSFGSLRGGKNPRCYDCCRISDDKRSKTQKRRNWQLNNNLKRACKVRGITEDRYWEMAYQQENRCMICYGTNGHMRLCIDHDHVTGEVRSLLCHKCNTGIGMFRENPSTLKSALEYTERHNNG